MGIESKDKVVKPFLVYLVFHVCAGISTAGDPGEIIFIHRHLLENFHQAENLLQVGAGW